MNNRFSSLLVVMLVGCSIKIHSMQAHLVKFLAHPQTIDVGAGIGTGLGARFVGRAVYQNIGSASQPQAFVGMLATAALGVGARAYHGQGSNPFLNALSLVMTAAVTLSVWPLATKKEQAEEISRKDKIRDKTEAVTRKI